MKANLILILFTIVSTCLSTSLQAQARFGVRVGANLAKQTIKAEGAELELDSKVGIDVAILGELPVSQMFALQPELHFIQKGYKLDLAGQEISSTVNYIEMPLLAKISFGDTLSAFIELGPSFGYAITNSGEGGEDFEILDFDEAGYRQFEISAVFGAGASMRLLGDKKVFIDIRYLLGLSNLYDDALEDDETWKNTGLNLGVGIIF